MTILRLIGRLCALFIILIFLTATPALILTYNVQRVIVEGDFLNEIFSDAHLFEAAISEAAKGMALGVPEDPDTRNMPIARLDADDWEKILYAIAPPSSMQRWFQDAATEFRGWVRQGGRPDGVVLPYGEVRDNIVGDPEQKVLRVLTEAQPPCRDGQGPLSGPNDLIPRCRPEVSSLEAFYQGTAKRWREEPREVWRQLWPRELSRYSEDISLADFIEGQDRVSWGEMEVSWRYAHWSLGLARALLVAIIVMNSVIALGLVSLLAARNWSEVLRWVGAPLTLAGLFTLLLGLVFLAGGRYMSYLEAPFDVRVMVGTVAETFSNDLWPLMSSQGGVLALIGLGLWISSFFIPARPMASAPVESGDRSNPPQATGL